MNGFPAGSDLMQILSVEEGLPAPLFFSTCREDWSEGANAETIYVNADTDLNYTAFFADFGPLDLGLTHKFCQRMETAMAKAVKEKKSVSVYCSNASDGHHRSNTAVLICAYLVCVLNMSAELAYKPFMAIKKPLTPFRDAAFALNMWPLFVLDCCRAFRRAANSGHYTYRRFDLEKFEHMSELHNGDMSWIVPGKFLAFSGPLAKRKELASGKYTMIPEDYCAPFKALNVTCVVRFNNKCYDKRIFERAGIRHVDMFYEDGGNPSESILQSFLKLGETQEGAIAVHCKAGLGRTGTNICNYMVKHLGYTIRESIAWHRICRPGAVVGPQQPFLCSLEDKLKIEGAEYKSKHAPKTVPKSQVQPIVAPTNGGVGRSSKDSAPNSRKNSLTNKIAQLNI